VGELFDGPARIEDEAERDVALRPIEAAQDALLDRLCSLRATTLEGHHARAATLYLARQMTTALERIELFTSEPLERA